MSVVAALSEWLVHTNRRADGSWVQRYEHGVPVTGLTAVPDDGSTGTTVRFRPAGSGSVWATGVPLPGGPDGLGAPWPYLSVAVDDLRA
ncbi:hypothetical protein [Streptomyces vinaceus]|uniref:hypothetical protein n=1 Tax=Streptomyces vinaceus TaxID=1960 RepID=UPI0036C9A8D9